MPPHWSHDSRHLFVAGSDKKGGSAFYQVGVENGEVNVLRHGAPGEVAAWSPDGTTVFYIDQSRLLMCDLESGEEKQLYEDENFGRRALAISRDGRRLVFTTVETERKTTRFLTAPTSGGEVEELFRFEKQAKVRSAEWTADDKYVLFSTREGEGSGLWRISVERGDAQKLLWNPKSQIAGFSLHPSGGQIALSLFNHETEIWAMEGFLPEEMAAN